MSDAEAALAALQADPGLPGTGVVVLCDFGAGGTSITLADAGANLAIIGETIRFRDFSGDQIDRALLDRVLAGIHGPGSSEPDSTAPVGALTRLRDECRLAKERLSTDTATVIPVDLPGNRSDVRITRADLDAAISDPLAGFLDSLADVLERNRIPAARLGAVAIVGGGAAIPAIRSRLSETLRVPVISTPEPGTAAAVGAATLAARGPLPEAPTSTATSAADAPTSMATSAADAPTNLAPAAWASGAAGQAATESASDGSPSATFRALAWSQDDDAAGEPVPYSGEDYSVPPPTGPAPQEVFEADDGETVVVDTTLPWYRRPPCCSVWRPRWRPWPSADWRSR